jgi:hypothetical protein
MMPAALVGNCNLTLEPESIAEDSQGNSGQPQVDPDARSKEHQQLWDSATWTHEILKE